MSTSEKISTQGLLAIKKTLCLNFDRLSLLSGVSRAHLVRIMSGRCVCGGSVQRRLVDLLGCTESEIWRPPTPERLAEIKERFDDNDRHKRFRREQKEEQL